jgi:branched-chain amino acid transport system substrate-binding protein
MKKTSVILVTILLLIGCSQNKNIIELGATFPLTGDVASYGIKAKNGIQLRIDEINKTGINGKKIHINFQDDKNSIKDAVNIFNTFATINKYPVVFGSAGSSVSLALVPISLKEKVVLISPVSGSAKLSSDEWKYFFRTIPSDNQQAEKLADWVAIDGIKNVALIYTNNSWGKPLSESFKKLFQDKGGNIVFEEGTPENTSDFRTIILKLKQNNFDAVIAPTYPKEGGLLVKQLKEMGVSTKLYGGDNWGAPEFVEIAGNAANGAFFTFPSDSKSPLWDEFAKNYHQKFGDDPDILNAYAYDAASAVIEAIKKSNSIISDELRKQLLLVNFEGVTGNISFKENGDITNEGYGKKMILKGKISSVTN